MKTLQELCLENIIEFLDRHILAYSTSTKLKSSYEIIRKKFSFEIIQKLYENGSIDEKHIDFLINKYLKTIDTDWLEDCSWEIIEKKFAEIGPSIETLYMNADDEDKDTHWKNIFCHLPNLKVVDFHACNEGYLDYISKFCSNIESISFDNSGFSQKGFQYICGKDGEVSPCPRIKEIKFNDPEFFEVEDIKCLIEKLPSLERINYYGLAEVLYSIHKDDLNNLANIKPYNLCELDMRCMTGSESYDDALKICLSLCPHLKTFSCNIAKQEHLNLCSELVGLHNLSLFNSQESPCEIDDFLKAKGSTLISLQIVNFSISLSSLAEYCPLLATLQLNNVKYQSHTNTMPLLYKLKSISFENLAMVDAMTEKAVASLLISSPNLEVLIFKNCQVISSEIQTNILRCCELGAVRHMDFSYSTVEFKFIHDVLLACFTLESINLECSTLCADIEKMEELESIAATLPNTPEILYYDMRSYSEEDDDFFLNGDYDDFYDSDDNEDYEGDYEYEDFLNYAYNSDYIPDFLDYDD